MSNAVYVNRKNDASRRKEQFLYDFNIAGKYKLLRERMKKCIVNLCLHKFNMKIDGLSFTGVTGEARDQFYTELHHFLMVTTKEVLQKMVTKKTD